MNEPSTLKFKRGHRRWHIEGWRGNQRVEHGSIVDPTISDLITAVETAHIQHVGRVLVEITSEGEIETELRAWVDSHPSGNRNGDC